MVPSIKASQPGPEAAKHPQTVTLPPPPCLTFGMRFLLWNAVFVFDRYKWDPYHPKRYTFDSSVHRTFFKEY
jgi:hypothetical protein